MKNVVVYSVIMLVLCAGAAGAQNKPQPAPAQPAPAGGAPAQAAATPPADPVNVRFEVRLREEGGGAKPTSRVVGVLATVMELSSVRANPNSRNPLNIDVMASIIRENKVRTRLTIEYTQPTAEPNPNPNPFAIRQTVNLWLDSGKPMVVSQAIDPSSDRRIDIEVTATILR